MRSGEWAHYWHHPGVAGVDLLHARYLRHSFARHVHQTYAIGLVTSGVEEFEHAGSLVRLGAGELALVNPQTVVTGRAGAPQGWTYRMLYPSVDTVRDVASDLGLRGTPVFTSPVGRDRGLAALLVRAHQAAESGDVSASSRLLHELLTGLMLRFAAERRGVQPSPVGTDCARRAREILLARLTDRPTLATLAGGLGVSPFALSRAFTARFGLPPHAYLNQQRVRTACSMLADGTPIAQVATDVGFTDQAHLTRHFRRIVGVTPGAYRRARLSA